MLGWALLPYCFEQDKCVYFYIFTVNVYIYVNVNVSRLSIALLGMFCIENLLF